MRIMKILTLAAGAVCSTALVTQAYAAQASAQFKSKIRIVAECKILSTSDIDFGTHGLITNNVDAEGNISVRCTPGTPFTLSLGLTGSSTQSARTMALVGNNPNNLSPVTYQIFLNSSRSTLWGINSGFIISSTGTGVSQNYPTYGRTPAGNYAVGQYQDTVTATLTY